MTCREKLQADYPDNVDKCYLAGARGCPHHYGYLSKPEYCDSEDDIAACYKCWDREIPETETCSATDNVNHPRHYETGKFECIDVMVETQGVDAVKNFCLCNAFKYIYRTRRKNGIEDVKKAIWYLEKYVELEGKQDDNQ
jgi:hypothetical protein